MSSNYGEFVGVSDVYYATLTDSASAYTPGTPVLLAPTASFAIEPAVATNTRYYSNKPYYITNTEGETKITVVIPGLDMSVAATLLGKYYNSSTKRLIDTGEANAPWLALGFAANVEGGKKYYWFLKGKFSPFKEEAETKGTDIAPKTTSLEFMAVATEYLFTVNAESKGVKLMSADNRLDNSITDATWFGAVVNPNQPTITVSAQPADDEVTVGSITESVSVTASASSGSLAYQWYSNTTETYLGATVISGATTNSYTLPTDLTAGHYFYFCRISIAASFVTMFTAIADITASAGE